MKGETKQGDSVIRASFRNIEAGDTPALHSNSLPRIGNFHGRVVRWTLSCCYDRNMSVHQMLRAQTLSMRCLRKGGRIAAAPCKWAW
jgi:hypothetical protein